MVINFAAGWAVLPLTIPGVATLQAVLVGANGAAPNQAPSGAITGTGPNFTWNAPATWARRCATNTPLSTAPAIWSAGSRSAHGGRQRCHHAHPRRTPALLRLAPLPAP
jgi:hypothetical protein